jgi:pimeloyl-ACP methyl ester carboxylesterase
LIFWGGKDAFFLREGQDSLVKNIRGSKWIVYEEAGHSVHWEQPQRFTKDLVDFIEEEIARKK